MAREEADKKALGLFHKTTKGSWESEQRTEYTRDWQRCIWLYWETCGESGGSLTASQDHTDSFNFKAEYRKIDLTEVCKMIGKATVQRGTSIWQEEVVVERTEGL